MSIRFSSFFSGWHLLLAKRLSLVFVSYTLCRVFFMAFNYAHIGRPGAGLIVKVLLEGLRFDAAAVLLTNVPVILLHIIPGNFKKARSYNLLLKALFLVINIPAVLLNIADACAYNYLLKRVTTRELYIFRTEDNIGALLPSILATYWFALVAVVLIACVIVWAYNRIKQNHAPARPAEWFAILPLAALVIVGIRGGVQKIPVSPIHAARNVGGEISAAVLNTPFTIYHSLFLPTIPETDFASFKKAEALYPCLHPADTTAFNRLNVVVIILEGFSAEYTGVRGGPSYTPYLDSLSSKGLVFTRCYANGKSSIEGVPSVLSGLPSYMDQPFISSQYGSSNVNSFASLLKPMGYTSAFFHGGLNGTMNFDSYTGACGYDSYYGLNEYTGTATDIGTWGVDDEPFLEFMAGKLDSMPQPFHAAVFTLSSHHPFKVPAQYKNRVKKGAHAIHECVSYTDIALKNFFERCAQSSWYNNTLFVLCADHTGPYQATPTWNEMDYYHIYAMLYNPGQPVKGHYNYVTQQTDLLPSVLDYLNYPNSYVAFGQSIFDITAPRVSAHCLNTTFGLIDSAYFVQYNSGWERAYHYTADWALEKPVPLPDKAAGERKQLLQAVIQNYRHRLLTNNLTARTKGI